MLAARYAGLALMLAVCVLWVWGDDAHSVCGVVWVQVHAAAHCGAAGALGVPVRVRQPGCLT
jgi:hypothetical protein